MATGVLASTSVLSFELKASLLVVWSQVEVYITVWLTWNQKLLLLMAVYYSLFLMQNFVTHNISVQHCIYLDIFCVSLGALVTFFKFRWHRSTITIWFHLSNNFRNYHFLIQFIQSFLFSLFSGTRKAAPGIQDG